ncbi:MAG: hypothetical protein CBC74_000635 [Crocinitomicaceae bacterium TMED114]|nr:MAG: hypothetical protein CBC74_000635 [Crocinitomicaceae bacterium TMED114]
MKRIITLFLATGLFASAFAQDAMQPQGSWYLGTADATDIFRVFSSEGMNMNATIGYAVADDIVVNLGVTTASSTLTVDGGEDITSSASSINVGGQYFFGDNFYGGLGVSVASSEATGEDETSSSAFSLGLGKYIPVKDMWYVSPSINYNSSTLDELTQSGVNMGISFGARF